MRFVEQAEQKAKPSRFFEDVADETSIILREAVKVTTEDGEEYLLEAGDTLRVVPKQ